MSDGATMIPLALLILGASGVGCDVHSLRCYETAVSSPGSGLPVYSIIAYVDERIIAYYTSDTLRYLPKVEWMKKLEAEYWEKEARRSRRNQNSFKNDLQTLMDRFNQTRGFHFYQWMYGCELKDDGSSATYMQYGYDGRDFMYLDTHRGIYIPSMNEAQLTSQLLNSPEVRLGARNKHELENECLEYLKKFIVYGRNELEKKVRPEVKVWGRQSDGVIKLYCLVYGFHPRAVDVKWMRNGTVQITSTEASPILPHPDGTYQIRVSVEVPTGERDSYTCHVEHSSLEEHLVFLWDPNAEPQNMSIVVTVLVSLAVVLSIAGIGFILYKSLSAAAPTGTSTVFLSPPPDQSNQALKNPSTLDSVEDPDA